MNFGVFLGFGESFLSYANFNIETKLETECYKKDNLFFCDS